MRSFEHWNQSQIILHSASEQSSTQWWEIPGILLIVPNSESVKLFIRISCEFTKIFYVSKSISV